MKKTTRQLDGWFRRLPLNMPQYQLSTVSRGLVPVASPIESSISECSAKSDGEQPLTFRQNEIPSNPFTIDYSYFINTISSKRRPSQLREITKMLDKMPSKMSSNCIKLGVGVPNVQTFPFKKISVELTTNEKIQLNNQELSDALQYLPSSGYAPLITILKNIQEWFHGPQDWENKDIIMTCGAQEGLCKAVDMCMERGDPVIMPDPMYTGAIDLFRPHDPEIIPIKEDSGGMIVEEIEKALKDRKRKMQPMPKMIYLNPTASNPAGTTLPEYRKREIYRLACEYNLLILEDDPYYYLYFEKENPASFLSMDTEGRVLRFDSFSKIMSAGLRTGFVTGHKRLIRQMELHIQTSSIHASSLSQVLLYKLLSSWGRNGLESHCAHVKTFYKKKRDHMMLAVENHLSGLAEWYAPNGGMFLWLKIVGLKDTRQLVHSRCLDKLLILAPGYALSVDSNKPSPYIRVSYSIASSEDVDRGISLLAEAIREELELL